MGKLNAILDLPEPERFVRELPSQELHHLIHHIGIADGGLLVPHCTDEQLQTLMDLDVWVGSDFRPERLERWFWSLEEYAEPEELWGRLRRLDPDLLVATLAAWTRVHLVEDPNAPPELDDGVLSFPSPDGRYIIEVLKPDREDRFPALYKMVEGLYAAELQYAHEILEQVRSNLPAEAEEDARRLRNARLEDLGFLPFEDSFRMYTFLDPEGFRAGLDSLLAGPRDRVWRPEGPPIGTALMALGGGTSTLLGEVLGTLDDAADQEQFILSFGYLVNRAAVVRLLDLSDVEAMEGVARAVFGLCNVGLEHLSNRAPDRGREILCHLPLLQVHRLGASLAEKVGRRARRLLAWLGGATAARVFDPPFDDVVEATSRRLPAYPEVLDTPPGALSRPFRSLAEVEELDLLVRHVEASTAFWTEGFGLSAREEEGPAAAGSTFEPDIRLSTLWLTLLARVGSGLDPSLGALPAAAVEGWAQRVLAHPSSERAREEVLHRSEALLDQLAERDATRRRALRSVVIEPAAARLVESLYGVVAAPYDPRALSDLFLVEPVPDQVH